MTSATLQFLQGLVNGLTLNVGAPDFDEVLATVVAARQELTEALAAAEPPRDLTPMPFHVEAEAAALWLRLSREKHDQLRQDLTGLVGARREAEVEAASVRL